MRHPVIEQGSLAVHLDDPDRGVQVVRLVGEADLASAVALRRAFAALSVAGLSQVIIDCSELAFIDSTGIRELLVGNERTGRDVLVTLRGVGPQVRAVFDVLDLGQVFSIEG